MLLIMERDTLTLSALLQRNSPAHGLIVKLPLFSANYKELSKKKTSGTQLSRSRKTSRKIVTGRRKGLC